MEKKFIIETEMEERWIPHFISMLSMMESLGDMGRSRRIQFYSDGDGDFRPKFTTNIEYMSIDPKINSEGVLCYDAG